MKKLVQKIAVASATLAMLTGLVGIIPASAATVTGSTTASEQDQKFKKAWSKAIVLNIKVDDINIESSLTIGYDTWWTNEDYVNNCWTPTGWEHKATVKNASGSESTGTVKGGFNTGKADIKHSGDSVTYSVTIYGV